ncbi:MAG: DUF5681 domain-containing protein [Rhodoferax sp.]
MPKSSASFKKGQSGNPAGRPPGTSPRARFRSMVDPSMPDLVQTLVQAAQGGDVAAIRVILDRTVPALKPTSDSLQLKTSGGLSEQGQAIIDAMSRGKCSPDVAQVAMNTLVSQSRLIEQSEVIQRIEALEQLICPAGKH